MKLTEIVSQYYAYRYPNGEPDTRQSLLWFLSEVGELAEAWKSEQSELSDGELLLFDKIILAGRIAEEVVVGEREWVRNNDRSKAHNVSYEIGDVLMMLTRFSMAYGANDPQDAMLTKMAAKGFKLQVDESLQKENDELRKLIDEIALVEPEPQYEESEQEGIVTYDYESAYNKIMNTVLSKGA